MERAPNRIYFPGNPYPKGHPIKEFVWSGQLREDESLWFNFHLKTEDYDAEDPTEDETASDSAWKSKGTWKNYHNCTLSSTQWGHHGGIPVGQNGKFNLDHLVGATLSADLLPLDEDFDFEDLAFHIYLLGHDSCADHRLIFTKNDNHTFNIEWTGKIALSYVGDDAFEYDFIAILENIMFSGFYYPKGWTMEQAEAVFNKKLEDFDDYEFIDLNPKSFKREYKLMPKKLTEIS